MTFSHGPIDDKKGPFIARHLTEFGYFFDNEPLSESKDVSLSSTEIEGRASEIEILSRKNGYQGGTLADIGGTHGNEASYMVYDEDQMDYEEARRRLNDWMK